MKGPSETEQELNKKLFSLRKEQLEITMKDNFVAHAKLQRKMIALEIEIKTESNERNKNKYVWHLGISYGIKALFGLCIFGLVIFYRHTPVYVFPEYMDLYPFNKIISYPNIELGSVSIYFWLMVTNSAVRQLIN